MMTNFIWIGGDRNEYPIGGISIGAIVVIMDAFDKALPFPSIPKEPDSC
ncbi:hypothetical protein K9N68_33310 [Kovacikia minuta CCNUW1]|nr:hypothetical protein [Kovacikia minuta]UBF26325.1 hypothetical protein K9N68_33310 [Kovacikia minuta CCNUW1]